jgi:hypothetical protein
MELEWGPLSETEIGCECWLEREIVWDLLSERAFEWDP